MCPISKTRFCQYTQASQHHRSAKSSKQLLEVWPASAVAAALRWSSGAAALRWSSGGASAIGPTAAIGAAIGGPTVAPPAMPIPAATPTRHTRGGAARAGCAAREQRSARKQQRSGALCNDNCEAKHRCSQLSSSPTSVNNAAAQHGRRSCALSPFFNAATQHRCLHLQLLPTIATASNAANHGAGVHTCANDGCCKGCPKLRAWRWGGGAEANPPRQAT